MLSARGLAFLVLLTSLLSGCGGSFEPYETETGPATRLDGTAPTVRALTVSEALRLHPREAVYVRGYVFAPRDEVPRLCAQLDDGGHCRGAPSLMLDTSEVMLDGAEALESGCCATGSWSPRPVVLRVRFERGEQVLVLG
jgi:hypothetical protein